MGSELKCCGMIFFLHDTPIHVTNNGLPLYETLSIEMQLGLWGGGGGGGYF